MNAASAEDLAALLFPSVEWFHSLAERMREDRARQAHIGDIDCVAQFTVLDGAKNGGPWSVQLTFEEYEVTDIREVGPDGDLARADFVVETDLDTWREMIESIAAGGGRPDLRHTLNSLSLLGSPIRVWSNDPVRRDMFFRFNQSLQEFFNGSSAVRTRFPE